MILSIIPYIVATISMAFDNTSSIGKLFVLLACILSLAGLLAYCLYQIFTPWVQQRRKEIAQKMFLKATMIDRFLRHEDRASLIDENGNLNEGFARRLFWKIDLDKDGAVDKKEISLLLRATLAHGNITVEEFLNGTEKWCKDLKLHSQSNIVEKRDEVEEYLNDLISLEQEEEEEAEGENPPTKSQIIRKAIFLLIIGTVLAGVFADPLVDAVNDFSTASYIPSFFISFVLLPFASNSNEAVSSILFAARKKKKNMSLTYSQIYGGVTMNNTMGLGIFLAVVYFRGLVWDFSSEVVIVCLVVIVMGLLASFRRIFPTWMAGIALILYPISLGLVAILDYVVGWE
ncbi:hypothetical protein KP509_20G076200 [Ceratopteris richardii]|uniref:EF-hand domain-containing protein n=1 Tax=Ceratopteris richardii TaxID=49495 RepID=A0A8T2SGG8_CERRI|nr:hypothetical protein KP509_20G076200 [Ceratopteris richardii]